jgi:hypothetical protein
MSTSHIFFHSWKLALSFSTSKILHHHIEAEEHTPHLVSSTQNKTQILTQNILTKMINSFSAYTYTKYPKYLGTPKVSHSQRMGRLEFHIDLLSIGNGI